MLKSQKTPMKKAVKKQGPRADVYIKALDESRDPSNVV